MPLIPAFTAGGPSRADLDAQSLWRTYTMLTDLEAIFRSLKSELGRRPVHHRTARRAKGHLFLTVLAYQAVQLIRHRLKRAGINESWASLRRTFSVQQRVTARFRQHDGRMLHVRQATRPEADHRHFLEALGLDGNPGGARKFTTDK